MSNLIQSAINKLILNFISSMTPENGEIQNNNEKKLRENHKKALEKCLKDQSLFYRCSDDPILLFVVVNNNIQKSGNPWLISPEEYNPSTFTNEIFERHVECLNAWKKWKESVPASRNPNPN